MRCEHCDQAERQPVRRAKLAQRDHKVAVVLEVPMEECSSCGDRWLRWDVAARLDELFEEMLASDIEVATATSTATSPQPDARPYHCGTTGAGQPRHISVLSGHRALSRNGL